MLGLHFMETHFCRVVSSIVHLLGGSYSNMYCGGECVDHTSGDSSTWLSSGHCVGVITCAAPKNELE